MKKNKKSGFGLGLALMALVVWIFISVIFAFQAVQIYKYNHLDRTQYTEISVTIDEIHCEGNKEGKEYKERYWVSFRYQVDGETYDEDRYFLHYASWGYEAPQAGDTISVIYENSEPEYIVPNENEEYRGPHLGWPWWGQWIAYSALIVVVYFIIYRVLKLEDKEEKEEKENQKKKDGQ